MRPGLTFLKIRRGFSYAPGIPVLQSGKTSVLTPILPLSDARESCNKINEQSYYLLTFLMFKVK